MRDAESEKPVGKPDSRDQETNQKLLEESGLHYKAFSMEAYWEDRFNIGLAIRDKDYSLLKQNFEKTMHKDNGVCMSALISDMNEQLKAGDSHMRLKELNETRNGPLRTTTVGLEDTNNSKTVYQFDVTWHPWE